MTELLCLHCKTELEDLNDYRASARCPKCELVFNKEFLIQAQKKSPFDINEMNFIEIKDLLKQLVRLMNHEHDRVTHLQNRILNLEMEKLKRE